MGTNPLSSFFFASGDRGPDVEAGLSVAIEAAGCDRVVGCSGMGVLSTSGELEQKSGVVAMAIGGDAVEAVPFLVSAQDAGTTLQARLTPYTSQPGILCVFSTISVGHPADLISQLSSNLDFPIVGGAASGSGLDPRTFQWLGTDVHTDAVSGVLLQGEFEILTGVAQGSTRSADTRSKGERWAGDLCRNRHGRV
jgi:small ligand-binding sensory domain FIST